MAQIDQLLRQAKQRGASDLHLTPAMPPMARVSGVTAGEANAPRTSFE